MTAKGFNREKTMVNRVEQLDSLTSRLHEGLRLVYLQEVITNFTNTYGPEAKLVLAQDYDYAELEVHYRRVETDVEHKKRLERHDRSEARKKNSAAVKAAKAENTRLQKIEALKKEASKLGLKVV